MESETGLSRRDDPALFLLVARGRIATFLTVARTIFLTAGRPSRDASPWAGNDVRLRLVRCVVAHGHVSTHSSRPTPHGPAGTEPHARATTPSASKCFSFVVTIVASASRACAAKR